MNSFIFDGTHQSAPDRDAVQRQQQQLALNMPKDGMGGMNAIAQALLARKQARGRFPKPLGGNTPNKFLTGLFGLGSGGLY